MKLKILLILLLALSLNWVTVKADDQQLYQQYSSKQQEIIELQQKLDAIQGQQKTLSSTIAYLNDKIKLTELQITETQDKLEILRQEISTLSVKIDRLDENLDRTAQLLISRVGEAYKRLYFKPMYLLLQSGGFNDFFEGNKYLQLAQNNDQNLLLKLQVDRDTNQAQKDIKENKQTELNALQKTLSSQEDSLTEQKQGKEELLSVTRNDEKKFQQLLAAAKADIESITNALAGGAVKLGPVTTNDVIGPVGSSGCSTGPHLHFEVFTNAKVIKDETTGKYQVIGTRIDPKPYLENGQYKRPVPNYPSSVTVWYGAVYFLGIHSGIDIANSFGTPIYPIANGTSYFVSSPCKNPPPGGTAIGKGILVDHENGLASLYWHIP